MGLTWSNIISTDKIESSDIIETRNNIDLTNTELGLNGYSWAADINSNEKITVESVQELRDATDHLNDNLSTVCSAENASYNTTVDDNHNGNVDVDLNSDVDNNFNSTVDSSKNSNVDNSDNVTIDNGNYLTIYNDNDTGVYDSDNTSVDSDDNSGYNESQDSTFDGTYDSIVNSGDNNVIDSDQYITVNNDQDSSYDSDDDDAYNSNQFSSDDTDQDSSYNSDNDGTYDSSQFSVVESSEHSTYNNSYDSSVDVSNNNSYTPDPNNIGGFMYGGYYVGIIDSTQTDSTNGIRYMLIVAPKLQGEAEKLWGGETYTVSGADSSWDGQQNTQDLLNDSYSHPVADFCDNLSINGYSDWYFPAPDEFEIIYRNFKPTTDDNNTSSGQNPNADPPTSYYTLTDPSQTTISEFQQGGSEALTNVYWTNIEYNTDYAGIQVASSGHQAAGLKDSLGMVRAVRRVLV